MATSTPNGTTLVPAEHGNGAKAELVANVPGERAMRVRFTIPRKAVGTNEAYLRAGWNSNRGKGGGTGLILSPTGRSFKECAAAYALVAAKRAAWPSPNTVTRVFVTLQCWNSRHDIDSCIKLSLDAFQGILYGKDCAVRRLLIEEPGKDDGSPRVEVSVEVMGPDFQV
jgi:hypothetical protein